jgi:hypothetical protein
VTALPEALRACASGILPAEAGTGLLTDCGSWLQRDDFTSQFVTTAADAGDGVPLMAAVGWQAAITALDNGQLPCSSGEGTCSGWPPASLLGPRSASATP